MGTRGKFGSLFHSTVPVDLPSWPQVASMSLLPEVKSFFTLGKPTPQRRQILAILRSAYLMSALKRPAGQQRNSAVFPQFLGGRHHRHSWASNPLAPFSSYSSRFIQRCWNAAELATIDPPIHARWFSYWSTVMLLFPTVLCVCVCVCVCVFLCVIVCYTWKGSNVQIWVREWRRGSSHDAMDLWSQPFKKSKQTCRTPAAINGGYCGSVKKYSLRGDNVLHCKRARESELVCMRDLNNIWGREGKSKSAISGLNRISNICIY